MLKKLLVYIIKLLFRLYLIQTKDGWKYLLHSNFIMLNIFILKYKFHGTVILYYLSYSIFLIL